MPIAAIDQVVAGATAQIVIAQATENAVVAILRVDEIIAQFAKQHVIAGACENAIVASTTVNRVIAPARIDKIAATPAIDHIIACGYGRAVAIGRAGGKGVVRVRARDPVIKGASGAVGGQAAALGAQAVKADRTNGGRAQNRLGGRIAGQFRHQEQITAGGLQHFGRNGGGGAIHIS